MTSWIASLVEKLGRKNFMTLMNGVLLRIPVIVIGTDKQVVDGFIQKAVHLAPHRQKIVFWSDFVNNQEMKQLFESEVVSQTAKRVVIISTTSYASQALQRIKSYKAWILGLVPKNQEEITHILSILDSAQEPFISIYLYGKKTKIKLSDDNYFKNGFSIEKRILEKVLSETKYSIGRISRLIKKKVGKKGISSSMLKNVLNFNEEMASIQQDIFEKELSEFVHASRRALALLTRIKLLREIGVPIQIDGQTLLDAIDYNGADPPKLIQFIKAEWNEDYDGCLGTGRMSRVGDWIDSMWGTAR